MVSINLAKGCDVLRLTSFVDLIHISGCYKDAVFFLTSSLLYTSQQTIFLRSLRLLVDAHLLNESRYEFEIRREILGMIYVNWLFNYIFDLFKLVDSFIR